MKASKGIVGKVLFNIIGIGSLVTLSACAQPVAETPTSTVPPVTPTDRASNSITVNNAKVTQPDIPASNGIVHVVDRALVPPNFPTSLNTTPIPR
ncbi:fasciclin domain-containing protein [Nostoc sp.]|uniref:fasciclin domain-containing protein n=1 Tax=Nostoc sp. TaxID=1180 RepID=UPI002FF87BE2